MTDFEQLTQAIQQFIEERDWKQFHKPKDCAISLTLESAEVAELFQWKTDEQMAAMKSGAKQEDLADELSDVLFWILAMAYDFNIDIKAAFLHKLEKSAKKYPVEKVKGESKKYTEY
ncbi:nucleotide pyrophosphohydrolase [Candidatus Uhrbacteria bacterium]|nr:nucleotide pyrophosphohydrolase [Candidatus Uhrbacteria bacterium]